MSLDLKGIYDESIARTPGDGPLDRVSATNARELLGGRPFVGVSPREVLGRFGMGVVEAGLIPTPTYGILGMKTCNGNRQTLRIGPPEGCTWRVNAAGAHVLAAGTHQIVWTANNIALGYVPTNSPEFSPEFYQTTIEEGVDPADHKWVSMAHGSAICNWQGSILLRYPDSIACDGEGTSGNFLILGLTYSEWPGLVVPPR